MEEKEIEWTDELKEAIESQDMRDVPDVVETDNYGKDDE